MTTKYMNPYLAGVLLGLVLLVTIFITGRGLGASGALKSVVVESVSAVAPSHLSSSGFYKDYTTEHSGSPLKQWLVFEVLGVAIGAFLSGTASRRLTWVTEKGPRIRGTTRIVFAFLGGALFAAGAQFARGCTSGAALSGMAVLSTGGFLTMMAIFGTGYAVAYFFRKLWL
ncbi:MAG TPA: YeeE/YedE thiosulfate transporter family protein [Bacteroidota bacterium]|nr:YeeE/YedE thiosulfate transporter family protein [Bacteroidota bacterium]